MEQINNFVDEALEFWLKGAEKDAYVNDCMNNSIFLYLNLKNKFSYEFKINIGSIILNEPVPDEYRNVKLHHYWNSVVINEEEHIIDISKKIAERILNENLEYTYFLGNAGISKCGTLVDFNEQNIIFRKIFKHNKKNMITKKQ
jgi:hypothetical protein